MPNPNIPPTLEEEIQAIAVDTKLVRDLLVGPDDPPLGYEGPIAWIKRKCEEIWNKIVAVGKGVGDLLKKFGAVLPEGFTEISGAFGGLLHLPADLVKLLGGLKVDSLDLAHANSVVSDIEAALDRLIDDHDLSGHMSNPATPLVRSLGLLSDGLQQHLFSTMDGYAPDWRNLPALIDNSNALIDQAKRGVLPNDDVGWRVTLVALKGVSECGKTAVALFPVSLGAGAIGGVAAGAAGMGEVDFKICSLGALFRIVPAIADVAHELVSLFCIDRALAHRNLPAQ